MNITFLLRLLIIAYTLIFVIYMILDCIKHRSEMKRPPKIIIINLIIGFFTISWILLESGVLPLPRPDSNFPNPVR